MFALLRREVGLSFQSVGTILSVVMFFAFVVVLFPFAVGPESALLQRIAPGVLWVAALLAMQLSLGNLFQSDFEDGSLDQLVVSSVPVEITAAAKIIVHWLFTALPLLAVLPLCALMMNLDMATTKTIALSLIVGTPALSALGAIGAALALVARRSSVLIPLLITPLIIPTLIFGVAVIDAQLSGFAIRPVLLILGSISLFSLPVGIYASALAIKQATQ